jgi:Wzt C-terminal domain
VLAVGDQGFTVKCLDKFNEFRRRNKSILLVTHSLDLVEKFCDQALWLDKGKTHGEGDPKLVVTSYIIDIEKAEERQLAKEEAARVAQADGDGAPATAAQPNNPVEVAEGPPSMFKATEGRWGSREIELTSVTLTAANGETAHVFHTGDPLTVHVTFRAHQPTRDFVFGIGIFNADGVCCYGTNTNIDELEPDRLSGDGEVRFVVDRLDLVEGTYRFDVAAHKLDGYPYDYHRQLYTIRVKSRQKDVGIYRPPHRWEVTGAVTFRAPGSGFKRGVDESD